MTDEIINSQYLDYVRKTSVERLVSHLNSVGSSIVNAYPMAEVQSWTIQREEAYKLQTVTSDHDVLAAAPFIKAVCEAQFGAASDGERAQQVRDKSVAVKANADIWSALSAYVNGLRARVQDAIEDATTEQGAYDILHAAFTELEQFRAQYGI